MIDAFAQERQFIDHLAPVWHALPQSLRGVLYTERDLLPYAIEQHDIAAAPIVRINWRKHENAGRPALVASLGDTKTGRLRGYTRFLFIEHGAGQSYIPDGGVAERHGSYAGGTDREDTSLFMVPNEYAAALWRQRYPDAEVQVVGCPRLDDLPRKDRTEPPVIAISFHWPGKQVPECDTAFGDFHRALPDLAKRFKVIGHGHPKGEWQRALRATYSRNGIEFVPEFADVCKRADVYICDNSSTLYEFAATGRPVVVLNAKKYRRDVHHGLRFWDAADVGVQVDDERDLVDAVHLALSDPPSRRRARENALSLVYAYRDGGAQRAADAVVRHLARPATLTA